MVPCICIDDSKRPKEIPAEKWVKKGRKYHVVYTLTVMPQKQLAFHLHEIELDETCAPYEYFLGKRFAFDPNDMKKLLKLMEDCIDTEVSVKELLEETMFETIETNPYEK
jgi:hypothetical protein